MNDERVLLDQRIAWLEFKMVQLLWGLIGVGSLGAGWLTYFLTVDHVGGWGAFGFAVVAWTFVGWYLKRIEFRRAPAHIKLIDP